MSDFTHHLSLWLDNDQGSYELLRDCCRAAVRSPWTGLVEVDMSRRIRWQAEVNIKDTVEDALYGALELLPYGLEGSIIREFIIMALANVEWRQLAESYLESLEDEIEQGLIYEGAEC